MRTKKNFAKKPEFLSILLVISVSIYQIIYYLLYEYGTPLEAKSIDQYKKENEGINQSLYVFPLHSPFSSDYNKLIDLNFTFHLFNLKCEHQQPFLLMIVYSAPKNFAKRKTIRQTWGAKRKNVLLQFALGETNDPELATKLLEESMQYKDFLQGSFFDSYKNLTYKHVMMLKYLIYHCPNAKYLLKADDDVYVNLPALLNFLTDVSVTGARNFLFCPPNYAKVIRSFRRYSSKWRLTFREYPHKHHPPSCNGFFFVYSRDVALKLYKEAQKTHYFWLEDVHITGHLFKKLGMDHVNARPFMIHQKKITEIMKSGIVSPWPFHFAGPDLSNSEIIWLNNFVLSGSNVPHS